MAVSVRKKKSVVLSSKPKMCFTDREFLSMATVEVSWPIPMRAIGAQNLLTMPDGVSTSGYLHKKGGSQFSLMKWPLRYIILHKGCVYYFKSSTSAAPQGAFSLNGYNRVMRAAEETTSSNVFPFKMVHFSKKHRTWYFSAASEDERRKWMRTLRREIDYYNDRKDSLIPSESDSDNESFYGTIERTMEIRNTPHNPEADYMVEDDDDDDDEEDYVQPDDSPASIGKPTAPPPSYPPPPVPFQRRQDSAPAFSKSLPLPLPSPNRGPTSPVHRKPPPPYPPPKPTDPAPSKGAPPPLPFAPHLQKLGRPSPASLPTHPPVPPLPPMASLKKELLGRLAASSTLPGGGEPPSARRGPAPAVRVQVPATLPVCSDLRRRMILDSAPSPGYHDNARPPATAPDFHGNRPPGAPSQNSCLRPGPPTLPLYPHPPPKQGPPRMPPFPKPTLPSARPSLQRVSPDGQSFRTSVDEVPPSCRKTRRLKDPSEDHDEDSDEDYENVQLPESVFVDTTETIYIEKLFKDSSPSPQDGLYCIRNSGTGRTSQVLVVWDVSLGKARNYRLFQQDSRVSLETDLSFPSLAALVEHYHTHPLPNNSSLCLQLPYGYLPPR